MADPLADSILANGTTYRLSGRWKGVCIFLGLLCTVVVVLIPLGIPLFIIAARARIITGDEGVVIKWLGTRVIRWQDFAALSQGNFRIAGGVPGLDLAAAIAVSAAKGAVSAMVSGPVHYLLVGKKSWGNIAMHWHEKNNEIADTFEARTGLVITGRPRPKAR